MVAQFLGLKLRLMANTFRRSTWQVVGLVLALLYGIGLAGLGLIALVAARIAPDIELVRNIVVVGGSAITLGFLLLPLLFGVDDTMDPRRFALYGIEPKRLARGLALAALIGIPSIVLAVIALTTIVTWSRNPGSVLLAFISALVVVASCVLGARVTTSIAAFMLSTRRARELSGLIGVLLIVMISPLLVLLANVNWNRDGLAVLRTVADWLSWLPLGAMWAAPADAARGEWGAPILKLLIALAFLAVLWFAWQGLVARMLVTPGREAQLKSHKGIGWFGTLPHIPAGAIAARSITYWTRDARYWVTLVLVPVFPIIMSVAFMVVGVPGHFAALLPLPVMCLLLGWAIHNDVAYDSTAIWLHVVSGTRGISDRIGRIVPVLLMGIPLIAIGTIVTVAIYGQWSILPAVIGVSTVILLAGVGLSSLTSALFPYPATKPGDSPFSQPQNTGALAGVVQSLTFLVVLILSAPAVVFAVLGIVLSPVWFTTALIVGAGTGVAVLLAGIFGGAAVFNRRGPEIMAAAVRAG